MKRLTIIIILLVSSIMSFGQVSNSGYIRMDSDSIFYEMAGTGNAIILIHDGILHREVWDDQFSFFSRNYKVIRYDRRGYGKSSPATGSYTHLDDLVTLFKQLKIDSAILVAGSSGGALAIDFTLDYPQKVNGLVLVGAVVGGFSYTQHMWTRGGHLPKSFDSDIEKMMYYAKDDPYEIFSENLHAKEKTVKLIKNNPIRINNRPRYIPREIPTYLRLSEIKAPALILVGEFDIPDVHAHAGSINAGISQSRRFIIPESGHLIPLEQPEIFNQTVEEFISNKIPKY